MEHAQYALKESIYKIMGANNAQMIEPMTTSYKNVCVMKLGTSFGI